MLYKKIYIWVRQPVFGSFTSLHPIIIIYIKILFQVCDKLFYHEPHNYLDTVKFPSCCVPLKSQEW